MVSNSPNFSKADLARIMQEKAHRHQQIQEEGFKIPDPNEVIANNVKKGSIFEKDGTVYKDFDGDGKILASELYQITTDQWTEKCLDGKNQKTIMIDDDGDGKADRKITTTKSNKTGEVIEEKTEYLKDDPNRLPAINHNERSMWSNFTGIFMR